MPALRRGYPSSSHHGEKAKAWGSQVTGEAPETQLGTTAVSFDCSRGADGGANQPNQSGRRTNQKCQQERWRTAGPWRSWSTCDARSLFTAGRLNAEAIRIEERSSGPVASSSGLEVRAADSQDGVREVFVQVVRARRMQSHQPLAPCSSLRRRRRRHRLRTRVGFLGGAGSAMHAEDRRRSAGGMERKKGWMSANAVRRGASGPGPPAAGLILSLRQS
ncbi:hypothetical protein ANO11243_057630 [Dothideomycetidae sp. 11243]|nr:hypothetical protein ANO11243_057630 [fungal sp. No.11243]